MDEATGSLPNDAEALPTPSLPHDAPRHADHDGVPSFILPPPPDPTRRPVARPGQLTSGWRTAFLCGWAGVVLSFAAVWNAARVLGLSTWWLGASTEARSPFVQISPFIVPLILIGLALRQVRLLPVWGIIGAAVCAGFAAGDIHRVPGLAAIEFAAAAAGLLVSVAAFAGMYRRA